VDCLTHNDNHSKFACDRSSGLISAPRVKGMKRVLVEWRWWG